MAIAFRNLLQDQGRLGLSICGVGLAIMLILILSGFLNGMNLQITSYIDHAPGSLFIAQEDVRNLLGVSSYLGQNQIDRVEAARGVAQAVPILSQFVILDLHEKKQPAYLVGYETKQGGGPWELAAGREPQTDREIVFDSLLSEKHSLGLGDSVEVLGQDFTIVGLSKDTASWMTSFFFIRKQAAEKILETPGASSFLFVTPDAGIRTADLRQRLSAIDDIEVLSKPEVAANDLKLFARVFSIPLRLMVTIAFLIGTLVVGLVIYTATYERQREYGMLKAIGAGNHILYWIVTVQALFAALAGSGVGLALAFATAKLIMRLKPQFLISITPRDIAFALISGLLMALIAALFPTYMLSKLAPAEVFRT